MAVPTTTTWQLEPHTAAKHKILRRYLQAWFPILSRYNEQVIYIDGFCGPGEYSGGEPGSPIIAIDVAISHAVELRGKIDFIFVDERQDRIDNLNSTIKTIKRPSNYNTHVECGKFDVKLMDLLDRFDRNEIRRAPTFAFVDPFGFSGIPFSIIEQLLRQDKCEVLITFMVDSINRFLEHPDLNITRHIVDAFGTEDVLDIAKRPGDRLSNLRMFYQQRLKMIARFVRYFEMRDHNDRIQYYLFFASNHELGHLKMKEAMWHADPDGEFNFSDATIPEQMVLFENDTTPSLVRLLRSKYTGKGVVSCGVVRKFIENETPYLKTHMTKALRTIEESNSSFAEPKKIFGTKRKKNTYPDDALVKFE